MVLGVDDKKFADKPFDVYKTENLTGLGRKSKKKKMMNKKKKMMTSNDIFAIGSNAK